MKYNWNHDHGPHAGPERIPPVVDGAGMPAPQAKDGVANPVGGRHSLHTVPSPKAAHHVRRIIFH